MAPRKTSTAAVKPSPIREINPKDMRNYDENSVLYVRNNTPTTVIWDAALNGQIGTSGLRLTQVGTIESVAQLPIAIARHPQFQKFWRKGKVTVTDDPSIEHSLEALAEQRVAEEEAAEAETKKLLVENYEVKEISWPGIGGSAAEIAETSNE